MHLTGNLLNSKSYLVIFILMLILKKLLLLQRPLEILQIY